MGTWFHSIDPFIFQITSTIGLRWYSTAYIMGFLTAYLLILRLSDKKITPLSRRDAGDFITWLAFGVILGGRLGYAIFYDQSLFLKLDSHFPYWGLLKVHHGGLASHGGIAGVVIACIWFAKRKQFSILRLLDLTALGGLGVFFGRIANFINGELFGRVVETKALWAVQFPQEMLLWVSEKKTGYLRELSSAVSGLKKGITPELWQDWLYQLEESTGAVSGQIYQVIYSLIKACEYGNQKVISALKPVLSYRHPSQIYQAVLEGLIPFIIVWCLFHKKKPLKPGVIGGVWALCYAIMRITGERFRLPDAHIGFQALGLTRGQWLSLFMLAAILCYFVLIIKAQKKGLNNGL